MRKRLRNRVLLAAILLLSMFLLPQVSAAKAINDPITVYVSISDDGEFVTGVDGTVMAHVPVEISYFDLADYGLADYYRYEADTFENGGAYISTRVMKQPTLLHLYIKVLEKYYAGRDLSEEDMFSDIINVTGSATHLYMQRFWGHDENLMYYVDHAYPLQAKGWGATCDYILLYDGADIDLGMFTDWNFYKSGAFANFDQTMETVKTGQDLTLTMVATATRAGNDGESEFMDRPVTNEPVRISADFGKTWEKNVAVTDDRGRVTLNFPYCGTYYVSAGPEFTNFKADSGMPNVPPPIAVITVRPTGDETPVTSVEIDPSSLEAPRQGEHLDDDASASGEGVAAQARILWSGNAKEDYGTALADTVYTGKIMLRPEEGYRFTQETSVTLNGEKLVTELQPDGTLAASHVFPSTTVEEKTPEQPQPVKPTVAKIKLSQVTKVKAKRVGKKYKLTWKKVAKAQKYQIQVKKPGTKKFKNAGWSSKPAYTTGKLKKKKTYQYRIRAYNKTKGTVVYGKWSKTRKIKG